MNEGTKTRRTRRLACALAVAAACVLAACGSSAASTAATAELDDTTTVPSTLAEPDPTPTTAAPATTTTVTVTLAPAPTFTETSNVVYMTVDGRDIAMDVFTPAGEGPWPVVIAFHGLGTKDDGHNTVIAEAAAAEGMLVFTPTWVDENSFPVTIDSFALWRNEASCALAFAQQYALANGGDPARTALHGFSAGIGPSLFASQQPIMDPIAGCATNEPPTPAAGVVLGDGEYLLHSQNFDVPFRSFPEEMQQELANMIDPSTYSPDLPGTFYLWAAENGASPRPVGDTEAGWFAPRNADGSLLAGLDQVGALDDGLVSYIDAGMVLENRLAEAGVDVTFDIYPGGHTTTDKVDELVGYLQAAVG